MADSTQYREKLSSIEDIPAPHDLVVGDKWMSSTITISTKGDYERGTLMMSSTDGFVKATSEGYGSASELCILCDDVSVPEDSFVYATGYFEGLFRFDRLVLWEDAGLESIRAVLRRRGIYLQ